MTDLSEPYRCTFEGCDKSFKRQEHLSRHRKCHDPAVLFTCEICKKEFNRKDTLNRHLVIHADELAPPLPKKSKTACVSCRKGKSKCNGQVPCSTCSRRQIECRYVENEGTDDDVPMGGTSDEPIQHITGPHSASPPDLDSGTEQSVGSHPVGRINETAESSLGSQSLSLNNFQSRGAVPINPQSASSSETQGTSAEAQQTNASIPPNLRLFGQVRIIDWMTAEVRRDPVNLERAGDMNQEDKLKYELYQDTYFQSFHHQWPLVHRPTYLEADHDSPSLLAIRMIGAWLLGTPESREFALVTHETMLAEILTSLQRITNQDKFQQSLSDEICDAAFLNIIFGLYQGDEKEISRSIMLLGVLVAALREVGFFRADTAWPDEKPNYFIGFRYQRLGKRQRLASYLFKIDNYLSIVRHHPPLLSSEELHFTLPSAFALWNSNGLHIWEERQLSEPMYRSRTRIYEMIVIGFSAPESARQPMLIEDIQTCLCATWSRVWRISKGEELLSGFGDEISPEKAVVQQQLDATKDWLERLSNQLSGVITFKPESYVPLKSYFGFEDPSLPESTCVATSRMRGLLIDALMLYHLLSIHLSSNIPSLVRLAKDQYLTPAEEASKVQAQHRQEHLRLARKWAASQSARRALCHSVDVLVAQAIRGPFNAEMESTMPNTIHQDPIACMSLVFAALVIHAFSIHADCGCQLCIPDSSIPRAELTRWSNFGFEAYKGERDSWIEAGNMRPQIHGLPHCQCSAGVLVGLYKTYLPTDWELADVIPTAPSSVTSS